MKTPICAVFDALYLWCYKRVLLDSGGAVAQLGARLDGIEEVVGSNPIGSTIIHWAFQNSGNSFWNAVARFLWSRRVVSDRRCSPFNIKRGFRWILREWSPSAGHW